MGRAVYICTGSSCRKKKSAYKKLCAALKEQEDIELKEVRCQKICSGPVVGLRITGKWEWFSKVRRSRDYTAIIDSLTRGKITKKLAERREKKRSGKHR